MPATAARADLWTTPPVSPYIARMDFLLRRARIVELDGGPGWVGPVDLLVEAGVVREVDRDLDRPAGIAEVDAGGALAGAGAVGPAHPPGHVDRHLRPARPGRHALGRRGTVAGLRGRLAAVARGAGRRLRPPPGHLAGPAHRGRARRGRARRAGRARQRRRPSRLAEHPRAATCSGLARRDDVLLEAEWYAAYARIHEIAGDETSPEAYLRMEAAAAALGRRRGRRARVRRERSTPGPPDGRRASTCCGYAAASTPTGSTRWWRQGCGPATRWSRARPARTC